MYDYELTLIGQSGTQSDAIGNQIPTPRESTVLCELLSVGRQEFYNAAAAGLRPSLIFRIHHYEYSGELKVRFQDQIYKVLRTYATGFEEIELSCERVLRDG